MKLRRFVFLATFLVASVFVSSCDTVLDALLGGSSSSTSPFTNAEAVNALKSALNIEAQESSDTLSKEGGYYSNPLLKIPLPPAGQKIQNILNQAKLGQVVDDVLFENVVKGINRSAEHAATEVVPIFGDAIKNMTVADGIKIVCGEEDAATTYLKDHTYDDLVTAYSTPINKYLDQDLIGSMSANEAWGTVTSKYNEVVDNSVVKIAANALGYDASPVNEDLGVFATEKALDGLFYMIKQEEAEIRENPWGYATDIISKVFGAVKNGFSQ